MEPSDKFCWNDKNMLVVTHFYATGPAQEFRDYLLKNNCTFTYTELPLFNSDRNFARTISYKNRKILKKQDGVGLPKLELLYHFRDFITIIFEHAHKYDMAFGFDNLSAFSLLILKKVGFIQKVVFVTVDYSPVRFGNPVLNFFYHWVDKYCCYNADVIWNSSARMNGARAKFHNIDIAKIRPCLVVDDGNPFASHKIKPYGSVDKYRLVYMGHLRKSQGVEMLLKVFYELHAWNSKVTLSILGDGELLENLKENVAKSKMSDYVFFSGYLKNHEDILRHLRKCYLAFALYEDDVNSFSKYSAVGKPKIYLGCGVPVLITDVPEIAKKIDDAGAGRIVSYNKGRIVESAKELISGKNKYLRMRENAIRFARENTWDGVFAAAIAKTSKIMEG